MRRRWLLVQKEALLLFFLAALLLFVPLFRSFLQDIFSPFFQGGSKIFQEVSSVVSSFTSLAHLSQLAQDLEEENAFLRARVARLEYLEKENETLRQALQLQETLQEKSLPALVIGKNPGFFYEWIRINRGEKDGIQKGFPVVWNGTFVGVVEEVGRFQSRVRLITHPKSAFQGVDKETGAQGLLRGAYGTGVSFTMVPQTERLERGDTVVTSPLEEENGIPSGMLVGTIEEVGLDDEKVVQKASLRLAFSPKDLHLVFILFPSHKEI